MDVHDRLPSGWSIEALRRAAAIAPRRARFAIARLVLGVIMVVSVFLVEVPAALLWFVGGLTLMASTLSFVVKAAEWSVQVPSLVCDERPKWGGRRFVAWRCEVDGLSAERVERLISDLVRRLDEDAGPSERIGDATTTRIAWGLGRRPSIDAGASGSRRGGDEIADGVWLRIDRPEAPALPVVTVLATDGDAAHRVRGAAAAVDGSS